MAVCRESCGTVVRIDTETVVLTATSGIHIVAEGVQTWWQDYAVVQSDRRPSWLWLYTYHTNGPIVRPRLSWSHRRCLRVALT
jgi:hypothetical protein